MDTYPLDHQNILLVQNEPYYLAVLPGPPYLPFLQHILSPILRSLLPHFQKFINSLDSMRRTNYIISFIFSLNFLHKCILFVSAYPFWRATSCHFFKIGPTDLFWVSPWFTKKRKVAFFAIYINDK